MMKLSDLQKYLTETLQDSGVDAADQEARIMLENRLGFTWADLIARSQTSVDPAIVESDLAARLSGIPLARIYGGKNFYGMDFLLSPETLEPRADTEVLVDLALENSPQTILDLGTGTGCILLSLLKNFPTATGIGVDRSYDALKTAQQNARLHGLDDRAFFLCGDWAESLDQRFDLVVSNPPYIDSGVILDLAVEVKTHDPILALDGGADGMDAYKTIFTQLPHLLTSNGIALFEIGYDQSRKILRLAKDHGFDAVSIHPDYAGNPRVAKILNGAYGDNIQKN